MILLKCGTNGVQMEILDNNCILCLVPILLFAGLYWSCWPGCRALSFTGNGNISSRALTATLQQPGANNMIYNFHHKTFIVHWGDEKCSIDFR